MSLYLDIRNKYGLNNPFLLSEISTPDNYNSIKVTINKLVKENVVKRYTKGIYYLPKFSEIGELYPSYDEILRKKYISKEDKTIGYYTGINLLNSVGLTTQVSNTREICTNVETNIKRKVSICNQDIILRKPLIEINNKNVMYLQFIDIFRYCDLFELLENDKSLIKEYINKNKLTRKEMLRYLDIAPNRVRDYMFGSGVFGELK